MANKETILKKLRETVIEFEEDECAEAAQEALDAGIDPMDAIMDGLAAGMEEVGVLFDKNEYFVPEVLMCADALNKGLAVLRPHLKADSDVKKASIIIGTIQGDVHDIGKNLVKMMFDVAGWDVHDLGADVPIQDFVDKQAEVNADILAVSAMMTTTMMSMKKIIAQVREKYPDCLIMLGGAPVTQDVVKLFGADGYAESAGNAVSEAVRMINDARPE